MPHIAVARVSGTPVRGLRRGLVLTGCAALAAVTAAYPAQAAGKPSDSSWYLGQFGMSSLWQHTKGSGVLVAEIGSGVNASDGDLAGRIKQESGVGSGAQRAASGDSAKDYEGTQIAALIVGTGAGGSKVMGLAPQAQILPIQLIESASSSVSFDESVAIRYAVQRGAKVVIIPDPLSGGSPSVRAAIKEAVQHGSVVIAAAGNAGGQGNVLADPCTAPGAICVSAVDSAGALWRNSNFGTAVSLAAPGAGISVPTKSGDATVSSSTHYAAALAAGAAALVWSAHPSWTGGQVVRAMLGTTKSGNATHSWVNPKTGYGIIDPAAAVAASKPDETTNPLLPVSDQATASPKPSHKAAAGSSSKAGGSSGSGSSSSSGTPVVLFAVLGGVVALLVLVGALLLRRRTPRNYLTDPAYMQRDVYYNEPTSGLPPGYAPEPNAGYSQPWGGYPQPENAPNPPPAQWSPFVASNPQQAAETVAPDYPADWATPAPEPAPEPVPEPNRPTEPVQQQDQRHDGGEDGEAPA